MEKDMEGQTLRSDSYPTSVQEKRASAEDLSQKVSASSPDSNHEEAEDMDAGHQVDLERQRTVESIRAAQPRNNSLNLVRTNTAGSIGRKMSTMASHLSMRSTKEKLAHEKLPEMDLEKDIVGWEGQNDPEMPLNFAPNRKWLLLGLLASITFIAPLASSMFAPAVTFMNEEFGNTSIVLTAMAVSIFVLGFAVGPLVLSPLSEIYGRRVVLTGANFFFVVWEIGCALAPNLNSLIAFRFLAGVGGSGCLTIGAGVIADLFRTDQRGMATAVFSLGPLFGPVVGPICGGFIAQRAGWRWIFWVLLIASGVVAIGIEFFNKETNPRVLIQRKTLRLQKELSNPNLVSCYEISLGAAPKNPLTVLRHGMMRPLKMLFTSPIVFLLSLYMSVVYGLLYLLFTTITSVFQETYHWQAEITGLAYIGLGLGFFTGVAVVSRLSDSTVVRLTKANNDVFEPEMRLPACVFFACFIPISFFWYGWSADYAVHWIVPIIGLIPFGFGMMGIFIPIQTYLIDSFPMYAASAVAALAFSRSLFGAFLPLAGPYMYASLGLGWGNSLLGFIAIALIPAPALIYKYGGGIRKNHPIKL